MHIHTVYACLMLLVGSLTACAQRQSSTASTIDIGYTYWWSEGGPFKGGCGDAYALCAVGNLVALDSFRQNHLQVDTRPGTLVITEVLALNDDTYVNSGDSLFVAAAGDTLTGTFFVDRSLTLGQRLVLTAYRYEGGLVATSEGLVPVGEGEAPLLASLQRYIEADYCPQAIASDTIRWQQAGYGASLQGILECAEMRPCVE